ncbi:DUF1003 domain-containing protein [Planctomycetota bacterium]|nr:DUF1003 domain-containing protein [Planctomycetota bacterium]
MKRFHLPHARLSDLPRPHLPHFHHRCPVTGEDTPTCDRVPVTAIQHSVLELIQHEHPDTNHAKWISRCAVDEYNTRHVQGILQADKGELTELDHEVMQAIREQEILSTNIDEEYEEDLTLGSRAADAVATFGGSWIFVISFTIFIMFWMAINTYWFFHLSNFDPYPFILLNLVLSCLAALQAPIIMMSQNRQGAKDRIRDENEYKVSLKAELEIRNLVSKMDTLMEKQWAHLIELQETQLEMLDRMNKEREETNNSSRD